MQFFKGKICSLKIWGVFFCDDWHLNIVKISVSKYLCVILPELWWKLIKSKTRNFKSLSYINYILKILQRKFDHKDEKNLYRYPFGLHKKFSFKNLNQYRWESFEYICIILLVWNSHKRNKVLRISLIQNNIIDTHRIFGRLIWKMSPIMMLTLIRRYSGYASFCLVLSASFCFAQVYRWGYFAWIALCTNFSSNFLWTILVSEIPNYSLPFWIASE